jgi:hypothetical protein
MYLNIFYFKSSKLRYIKPVSAATSPTNSRSSTPHNFDEDDEESEDDEELKQINNNSNSEASFSKLFVRSKSTENDLLDAKMKTLNLKKE